MRWAGVVLLAVASCGAAAAPEADGQKQRKLPTTTEVPLATADGVRLATTFYPGTKGKDSVPVVLLHMSEGSRKDYAELAPFLQERGHAVLVPDLRGHGDSVDQAGAAPKLSDADYRRMVAYDMEAIKDYLRQENNAGNLNIEKLCLVGAEMGASVALAWTQLDWSRRPVGRYKLGQDVKAMVLISPCWSIPPGLPLNRVLTAGNARFPLTDPLLISAVRKGTIAFKDPSALDMRREVSILIVAGQGDSKAVHDARRVDTLLKRFHPDPAPEERDEQLDLFYGTYDTSLQGTKMLNSIGARLREDIATFIERRLVSKEFPWQERKKDPHVQGG